MFARRTPTNVLRVARLDAGFYDPLHVENASKVERHAGDTINSLCPRLLDHSFLSIRTEDYQSAGVPFVRVKNLKGMVLDEDFIFINEEANQRESQTICTPGDLLFAKTGKIAACPVPSHLQKVNTSQDVMVGTVRHGTDPYYVAAYLNCRHGSLYQERYVQGPVQPHLSLGSLRQIYVVTPRPDAQRYIGDKVRQAERLRERARRFRRDLDRRLSIPSLIDALKTTEQRANRVTGSDLNPRLDSKYYGSRAMAVLDAAHADSVAVGALVEEVSNGFEHRDFDAEGTPYITVTEVSGGRLVLATAPRLGAGVSIPEKARIDTRCALVVRTGSVGVAVPVFEEDTHAAISSHLIRLRFKSEAEAAVVAAFLNSEAGRVLQRKISYGAVQPQIGQDELLALPIPKSLLDSGESVLSCLKTEDAALRAAQRLTATATILVERLIDGRLTEADLVAAQKALESGNRSADREILKALRQGDTPDGKLVIADVDALYALLDGLEGQDA